MSKRSKAGMLRSRGLTNHLLEDISVLATSSTKKSYDWFCSSRKCCMIEREFYSKKTKKFVKVQKYKNKVLKYDASYKNYDKCPDCGSQLFSCLHR